LWDACEKNAREKGARRVYKERAMESRRRRGATQPCEEVWSQRLELHSIQGSSSKDWQVLSSSLGQ